MTKESEMPMSEFSEELVERCAKAVRRNQIQRTTRSGFVDEEIPATEPEQLNAIAILRESGHKELVEALRPFAEKLASVEAFIEDRASNGGSPIMPMNGLRLANFRNAVAALRKAGALPAETAGDSSRLEKIPAEKET